MKNPPNIINLFNVARKSSNVVTRKIREFEPIMDEEELQLVTSGGGEEAA